MAFSGPTIWGHLDARLVADWPPALTHSCTLRCPHNETLFCSSVAVSSLGFLLVKRTNLPIQILPLWSEYRSLNWIAGVWPVHSSSPSSTPLPFSLTLCIQLTPQLSLSSQYPTVPPCLSSCEMKEGTYFLFPPAYFLMAMITSEEIDHWAEARAESGSRKIFSYMKYFHWSCWLIFTFFLGFLKE